MTRKRTPEEARAAFCRLKPSEVWRRVALGENWAPNFPGDKVKAAIVRLRPVGGVVPMFPCRVRVWGMDDLAMERDGLTRAEAEQLLRDLPEPLPMAWLREKGFVFG